MVTSMNDIAKYINDRGGFREMQDEEIEKVLADVTQLSFNKCKVAMRGYNKQFHKILVARMVDLHEQIERDDDNHDYREGWNNAFAVVLDCLTDDEPEALIGRFLRGP